MKILNKGNERKLAWWVNAQGECRTCGRRVQLERNDDERADFNRTEHEVTLFCPCGDFITLNRAGVEYQREQAKRAGLEKIGGVTFRNLKFEKWGKAKK